MGLKCQLPTHQDSCPRDDDNLLGRREVLGILTVAAVVSFYSSRKRISELILRHFYDEQTTRVPQTTISAPVHSKTSHASLEEKLLEGDGYLAQKHYDKAIEAYRAALGLRPDAYQHARANSGLGNVYFQKGKISVRNDMEYLVSTLDYETAVKHFNSVIESPEGKEFKREALYLSALALLNIGRINIDGLKDVEKRLSGVVDYNIKDRIMEHALYLAGKINLDNDGIFNEESECHERMPDFSLEVAKKHFERLLREFPHGVYAKDAREGLKLFNELITSKKCK